jgi:serine/threonine protein phosphatase PrpC
MEDRVSLKLGIGDKPNMAFFAIFDGHGGDQAAEYMRQNLLPQIEKCKDPTDPKVLRSVLAKLDLKLLKSTVCTGDPGPSKPGEPPPAPTPDRESGTTACFAVVYTVKHRFSNKPMEFHVTVANVGDSRLLHIPCDGKFKLITKDHKPEDPSESARVRRAGGTVRNNRVDGELAMSRAVGDYAFKLNAKLPADEQKVVCTPDVYSFVAAPGDYVLLACDGVYERLTVDQVAKCVAVNVHPHLKIPPLVIPRRDFLGPSPHMSPSKTRGGGVVSLPLMLTPTQRVEEAPVFSEDLSKFKLDALPSLNSSSSSSSLTAPAAPTDASPSPTLSSISSSNPSLSSTSSSTSSSAPSSTSSSVSSTPTLFAAPEPPSPGMTSLSIDEAHGSTPQTTAATASTTSTTAAAATAAAAGIGNGNGNGNGNSGNGGASDPDPDIAYVVAELLEEVKAEVKRDDAGSAARGAAQTGDESERAAEQEVKSPSFVIPAGSLKMQKNNGEVDEAAALCALLDASLEAGSKDNMSACLVRFCEVAPAEASEMYPELPTAQFVPGKC